MVSFGDAVRLFFGRYVDFQGRSSRSEYWWVALFNLLVIVALGILFFVMGGAQAMSDSGGPSGAAMIPMGIGLLYMLAIILPSIALAVRRFHDLDQTGWLYLVFVIVGMIPLVGFLASIGMIVWFCIRGTVGPNKYGDDPVFE